MNRQWLYVALLVLAAALLVSTGSFSAMSADRGVNVAVADDDSAYVGYSASCEGDSLKVTITNRFDNELTDGTVTIDGTEETINGIGVGERVTVTFDEFEWDDRVRVTVSGGSTSAELDRSVNMSCSPSTQDVIFSGNSDNTVVHVDDANGTYWTRDGKSKTYDLQASGQSIRENSDTIVAVYVHQTSRTYVHPDLVNENGTYTLDDRTGPNEPCTFDGNVSFEQVDLSACQ